MVHGEPNRRPDDDQYLYVSVRYRAEPLPLPVL